MASSSSAVKLLAVVVGVGLGGFAILMLRGRGGGEPEPKPLARREPCGVPAGLRDKGEIVTWNPISPPGRCAPTSTRLVVDNGTQEALRLALGDRFIEVGAGQRRTIVTVPGRFELRSIAGDGSPLDTAAIDLVEGHVAVYNPQLGYDYIVRKREYGGLPRVRTADDPTLPPAVLFDAGPIDFLFEPLPDEITVEVSAETPPGLAHLEASETRTALEHRPSGRQGRMLRRGALSVVEPSPGRLLVFDGKPELGRGMATLYIDNPEAKAELALSLDGAEIAVVTEGGTLSLELPAGRHRLQGSSSGSSGSSSAVELELAAGERWVWSPGGRREFSLETVEYGYGSGGGGKPRRARGLIAFRVTAHFVFEAPESIQSASILGSTRTLLKRGRIGDYHVVIAKEIAAVQKRAGRQAPGRWAQPDPETASECDLLAVRGLLASTGSKKEQAAAQSIWDEAVAWGCELPEGAHRITAGQ